MLLLFLLLKFICTCTCTRTIAGQQQHETVTPTTTTTQSNLHKLLKRAYMSSTACKCEHFIWKAHSPIYMSSDLGGISYLSVHFIWQVDLVVHFIWKWPNFALCHKMSLGGISDLIVCFIWQVDLLEHFIWKFEHTCHFMLCFTEGLFVLHMKDLTR